MSRFARGQRGFWIIYRGFPSELLAVSVPGIGEALAVFSFEEEAELYLILSDATENDARDGLRTCPVSSDALLALLRGPGSHLEWVVLDPMPERNAGFLLRLASLCRGDFLGFLSGHAVVADSAPAGILLT
jgi:hypothetical protein